MNMKDTTVRSVYTGDIYPGRPTWSPSGEGNYVFYRGEWKRNTTSRGP